LIEERLAGVKSHRSHENEEIEDDWSEAATQKENDEVLDGLDDTFRDELRMINAALNRIAENEYGICVRCHKPIAPARLEALPYAVACVKC
jgi:DnaK suppressor protein